MLEGTYMIKKSSQMDTEVRENMKGGKGAVSVTHLLRQVQMTGKCRFLGKMAIKPGCSIGLHSHDQEEEIYYILKGQGIVVDNDIKQEVSEGDVVLTGGGASHSIENASDEDLEVLGIILLF
jgi:mannose-6-phosphate isomerase-like protein (cupin superfamily)